MNESTNQPLSPDGLWRWDGHRWLPAGTPRVVGRRNNWLRVFAVLAVTSVFWGPALFLFVMWAGAYFMAGYNGHP